MLQANEWWWRESFTGPGLQYLFGCLQKRIRRRTDVGLVGTAPPVTKNDDQVFCEASLCSSCGCSYSIAVATIGVWIKTDCSEETLGVLDVSVHVRKAPLLKVKRGP